MPQFAPASTNLIILYGEESCKHLGAMLAYWNTIISPADWNAFVFLLIGANDEALEIRPELKKVLMGSRQLSLEDLKEGTKVDDLTHELRRRMGDNGTIAVQCVCAGLEKISLPPQPLLALVRDVSDAFVSGAVHTIFYLMLKTALGAHAQQRAFAQALGAAAIPSHYVYLLGNITHTDSAVPKEARWRAIFAELLANSAMQRVFAGGSLYSVGLSTLNANDSELTGIRKTFYVQWLRDRVAEKIQDEQAWSILSRTGVPWSAESSFLGHWMAKVAQNQMRLPGEAARKNNRILTSLYQREISAIPPSIERFYEINCEASQPAAAQYCQAHVDEALKTLATKLNAPSFPIPFVEKLIKGLEKLAASAKSIGEPILPPKRFGESGNAYCDRCCEIFEKYYEQRIGQQLCGIYAGEMAKALTKVQPFVQRAKEIENQLSRFELSEGEKAELGEKYPGYCKEVEDTIHFHAADFRPYDSELPYYYQSGQPNDTAWDRQVTGGAEKIKSKLSPGFKGSFCDAVNTEYGTTEGIQKFFGRYLEQGQRMFFNLHDAAGGSQALYYVDHAFAKNPWFSELPSNQLTLTQTDNVERVNCFPLAGTLEKLLEQEDSRYFSRNQPSSGDGERMKPLFGGSWEIPEAASEEIVEAEQGRAPAPQIPNQGLHIVINNQGRYVLVWDWIPNAPRAIVKVHQQEQLISTLTPTAAEYNTAKGNCTQGLDITSFLPYGHIRVELCNEKGALYARRDMAGRKNDIFYCVKPNGKGRCELRVKGHRNDLNKAILCVKGREGEALYYPIHAVESAERFVFAGLWEMPLGSAVQPYPEVEYPTFRALIDTKV